MNYTELIRTLRQNGSKSYNEFNNKIVNSGVPMFGCSVPFVRKLAASCTLEEAESFPVHAYYEVDLLRGIVVSDCKLTFEDKSVHLLDFAQTIENWAVCDCSAVKVPRSERERYFVFFCDMLDSARPFVCRYGTVNLMNNFLDGEYVKKIFEQLSKIAQWGQYYVDMGVAWLVATAMAKCRDETVFFMENDGRRVLDKFAYNRALQKMRDSFRVSAEDKEWSRSMTIK